MELQKLAVKIFVESPNSIPLTDFIGIFHGWIQAADGAYHDVADYSHMHAGPGIVLIAGDANLSIDESGARRGLLFCQKRRLGGSNQEKLRQVWRAAVAACRKIEAEETLAGKLRFDSKRARDLGERPRDCPELRRGVRSVESRGGAGCLRAFRRRRNRVREQQGPPRRLTVRVKAPARKGNVALTGLGGGHSSVVG